MKIITKHYPSIVPIGRRKYRLVDNYRFKYEDGDALCIVSAKEGMITDGASVPQWLWSITGLTPDGLIRTAALVHDRLYQTGGEIKERPNNASTTYHTRLTRSECDKLFKAIMLNSGIKKWRCTLAYWGVRLFGGLHWKVFNG